MSPGGHYRFKANTANVGAASINLNAIGAKTIVKVAGGITTALSDNDIRVGQWVDLVYDGTNMQMQSTLGNAAAGGTGCTTSGTAIQKGDGAGGCAATSITDNGTTVAITEPITAPSVSTGTSPPAITAGTAGVQGYGEGTMPSVCAAAAVDCNYADATQHGFLYSYNNGSFLPLVQGPASSTANHAVTFNSTNGGLLKDSGLTLTPSTGTFTLTNAKTFTVQNSLTIASTDGITETTPTTSFTAARTDAAQTALSM
jgi:hypothetical protein